MDAVYMLVEVVMTMMLDISNDYLITGEVTGLDTEIKEFKTYFYSRTSKEQLNSRLKFYDSIPRSYINNMLKQGLELPLPTWLLAPMTKPRFTQYDGYFLFDTEPKVKPAKLISASQDKTTSSPHFLH